MLREALDGVVQSIERLITSSETTVTFEWYDYLQTPLQLLLAIKELKARSRGNYAEEPEEAEEQINQGVDDDEITDWKSVRVQLEQLCGEFGKQTGKHRYATNGHQFPSQTRRTRPCFCGKKKK
ncbi:unnamed protein product [Nippostrongylus brasiliensis]|uniref:Rx_N domain-containing protein n=1 Tax=Nippostrongylus brasiliensis TaxID=27835 RepID=A0A0N4YE79_NIPBR|nr:unnamed protein product [Nippostrongylus brasiliensis]